ncbi:hypothetical protein B0P06_001375 [Clostridium saccharoperbutylacetonicum]|uniref:Uncharacterized protein n=1 Tax=Clostridium saccharoperbutylacetonicum N1-4(HMT) TaxID=931276 RepID=M1MSJ2_9CLOT|nr:hypothetical protein [Clostridium saccharoperbutylacetonicum]AGF54552.1 hypothetical protein Cspa_c07750 [Clostridium saccharoperbutylacetonicum N1-4(HMT)]NRT58928.1 hypothetical protein [Clostridium saccharoperbutylacetonicum]NSB28116.1 hypothetical protein [Clostridium saccharoperbutylacetonicum]NSB41604.1 hypothetical protein [Clostridium saccharoperbutylacetonicum]
MSLNLDKTDLKDNVLIIQNDDNSIKCIPRENATDYELSLFKEFEVAYPNGKPVPLVEQVVNIATDRERIEALENYLLEKETAETIK